MTIHKKIQTIFVLLISFFIAIPAFAAAPDGASGPWADSVVSTSQGLMGSGLPVPAARSDPSAALGVAENDTVDSHFFSLGFGGNIVLGFENGISSGVFVVEATNPGYPLEKAKIEVSENNTTWVDAGIVVQDGTVTVPEGVTCAKYVRITDISDPTLFTADVVADGYDVDGAEAIGDLCTPRPVPATLHVIKQVVNTNGSTASPADFSVHVKSAGTDVSGSPAAGTSSPGSLYSLIAGTYLVSEDVNASSTETFSGDCDSGGSVTLLAGDNKTCTVTNTENSPTSSGAGGPAVGGGGGGGTSFGSVAPNNVPGFPNTGGGSTFCPSSVINLVPVITEATRVSPTSIFVSWMVMGGGINDYVVHYGLVNGDWQFTTNVTGNSTTINNLPENQDIWIEVAETNNCTVGTFGGPVHAGIVTQSLSFPNTGGPAVPSLLLSKNTVVPKLPNTGIGPTDQNNFWVILASLVINFGFLFLAWKMYKFLSL